MTAPRIATATTGLESTSPETEGEITPEISVLIPVLNEEGSLDELVERLTTILEGVGREFEILFVDDGSTDSTVEKVRKHHATDPRVKLVRFRRNFGKAAALTAGVEHTRGPLIVTLDGDLQDVPEEIPRLLAKLEDEDLDLVSGWKQVRRDPISKRYPSKLFNWVTCKLSGVDLHDLNCGFKIYRREVLEQVSIYGELHRYIPVLASRKGFRVDELPVAHEPRRHGVSKYGWDRLYKGFLDLITVLFITTYMRRPLHLFGLLGLSAIAVGGAICTYLAIGWLFFGEVLSFRPLLQLGILLIVLGAQILTTGLLAEMLTHRSFRRAESYSIRERLLE